MSKSEALEFITPNERDVRVTRVFDAPKRQVFAALTKPEFVRRWLLGPPGWTMPVCEIDLRVGGKFRYVWRHDRDGSQFGMGGEYREIAPPDRLVHTELFDEDWTGGETLVTTVLEERNGRTSIATTVRYSSQRARDGALKTGMIQGWAQSYDRLAELLASSASTREPAVDC